MAVVVFEDRSPAPVRVRFLVRGADNACALFRVVDRLVAAIDLEAAGRRLNQPQPTYQGAGWWSMTSPYFGDELASLAGLLSTGGGIAVAVEQQRWQVVGGPAGTLIDGSRGQVVDELRGWVAQSGPAPAAPRRARKHTSDDWNVYPDTVSDDLAVAFAEAGWRLHPGFIDRQFLDDFDFQVSGPNLIGEGWFAWSCSRWIAGMSKSGPWGLWDRDHPGPPVLVWPDDPQRPAGGRDLPWAALQERVEDPVLAATRLVGQRLWTTYIGVRPITGEPEERALLAHWNERSFSVLSVAPRPFTDTILLSRHGHAWLSRGVAGAMRAAPAVSAKATQIAVPLLSLDDALEVTRARYLRMQGAPTIEPSDWQPVPDDVPRGLLETAEWIRSTAGTEPRPNIAAARTPPVVAPPPPPSASPPPKVRPTSARSDSDDPTAVLSEFLGTDRGASLIADFLADVGGDPDTYGFDDLDSIAPPRLGDALKTFLDDAATQGLIPEDVSDVLGDERIDWTRLIADVPWTL